MRKIFEILFLATFLAMSSVVVTSCGSDDEQEMPREVYTITCKSDLTDVKGLTEEQKKELKQKIDSTFFTIRAHCTSTQEARLAFEDICKRTKTTLVMSEWYGNGVKIKVTLMKDDLVLEQQTIGE